MVTKPMVDTPLCRALDIDVPIVQAPIGRATRPELAATVADAGGLGMLSVTFRSIEETQDVIRKTAELTKGQFAVNLVLDEDAIRTPTGEHIEACLDAGAAIISLSHGDAGPYVDRVHETDGLILQTVGTAREARDAASAGVDVVVTQGWEAGGHVQSEVATLALVPRVADAVDVPIIAAGGIADGRGIAAVLALGADGAWLGTRFLAAEEAAIDRRYREKVLAAEETSTVMSELFDGGWPSAPHRTLRNSTVEQWEAAGSPAPGNRPNEGEVIGTTPDGRSIERYSALLPFDGMEGNLEAMAMYAGQSAGLTDETLPAGAIVEELTSETRQAIEHLNDLLD